MRMINNAAIRPQRERSPLEETRTEENNRSARGLNHDRAFGTLADIPKGADTVVESIGADHGRATGAVIRG